ncbi:MAG: RidA family protein [Acidimicrobiia bacterium]|nr:RidA family protein [Acidimicrobiia bacterium]MDH3470929.1 RidA family protein [Acidimicrobiia bacterium]
MKQHNPATVAGPFATYTHGVEIDEPVRFLFGAGQVGVHPDGTVGEDIEQQARLVWRNIGEVLASAGMEISDIVQLNMLLLDRADREAAAAVRQEVLGDHRPASTLMYVVGLSRPEWRIEVDFIAARPVAA